MNEPSRISRKKAKTPDNSNPSFKPKVRGFGEPQNESNWYSTTPAAQKQQNQENISLKRDAFGGNFNILEKCTILRPQENVQRQEVEEEKDDVEQGEVVQAKLNNSESAGKQEEPSIWQKVFQIQQNQGNSNIQRQEEVEEEKEEIVQGKLVQTKLTVGEAGDKYEQEADSVAAKVVEQINSPKSEQPVQGKIEPVVQPMVMRQGGVGGGTVNENVEQNIQQARGSGQGLAYNVREPMEQAFGTDFSGVKVHTGGQADVLNRSLNARAFTTGQDIFFKQGEYNPGSKQGQELLAHELTHVVQQTGKVQRQPPKESKKTINGSASSISWIDPASPAGKVVSDSAPPATITEGFVTGNSGFRFSNYLHGYVKTDDSVTIDSYGFYSNSGIYRGPSFGGCESEAFPITQKQEPISKGGIGGIKFEQLVGARTNSPAKIGGGVGAGVGTVVGTGVGWWGGTKLGATGGSIFGLPGAVIGGVIRGGIGAVAGYFAGTRTANSLEFSNFPPIWTRITLTLMADGSQNCQLLEHSIFPSNNFYCDLKLTKKYSALASKETAWKGSGWGSGNPWGKTRPTWTP